MVASPYLSLKIELTQLLVALANIIAHDGNFDSRRCTGGNWLLFFCAPVFPAWINLCSALLMKLLSAGSSVTLYAHVITQRNPRDENKKNGPEIPIVDSIIGVSNKPRTLPRWNPAIDIPSALALSLVGNHLFRYEA